jgi:hypothetical protein
MFSTLASAECPQGQTEVRVIDADGAPKSFVAVEFLGGPQQMSVLTGSAGVVCATLAQGRTYTVRVRDRGNVQTFPGTTIGQRLNLQVKWR